MTKKDLIDKIHLNTGYSLQVINNIYDQIFLNFKEELKKGSKVCISNFGTFEAKKTQPFNVYSPFDGKLIENISQYRIHFKSSNALKDYLNNKNI